MCQRPASPHSHEAPTLRACARVAVGGEWGLGLAVANLAIPRRATGRDPLDALDGFPLERVVEIHVAGGTEFEHGGRTFVDDDHGPAPLADTWRILEAVVPRAVNLRALVFECERNPVDAVVPVFERLRAAF